MHIGTPIFVTKRQLQRVHGPEKTESLFRDSPALDSLTREHELDARLALGYRQKWSGPVLAATLTAAGALWPAALGAGQWFALAGAVAGAGLGAGVCLVEWSGLRKAFEQHQRLQEMVGQAAAQLAGPEGDRNCQFWDEGIFHDPYQRVAQTGVILAQHVEVGPDLIKLEHDPATSVVQVGEQTIRDGFLELPGRNARLRVGNLDTRETLTASGTFELDSPKSPLRFLEREGAEVLASNGTDWARTLKQADGSYLAVLEGQLLQARPWLDMGAPTNNRGLSVQEPDGSVSHYQGLADPAPGTLMSMSADGQLSERSFLLADGRELRYQTGQSSIEILSPQGKSTIAGGLERNHGQLSLWTPQACGRVRQPLSRLGLAPQAEVDNPTDVQGQSIAGQLRLEVHPDGLSSATFRGEGVATYSNPDGSYRVSLPGGASTTVRLTEL